MISRSLFAAVWLASTALAGPPLTTIQDVLYKADGTRFAGTLTISWTSFEAIDTSAIASQVTTVTVTGGNLRVQLVPTTTAVPAANYSVKYTSDGRIQFSETWAVPSSVGPLRVRDVRIASTQPGVAGAVVAPPTVQESDVAGLISDLGARPLKGPGYAAGRVTAVNPTGSLDSVTGSPSDCVRVDGSSGPCGGAQPAFVDGESPSGIADGANATFTLSAFPNPGSSLAVYRNGVLQKLAQDYNLTGNSVQFVTAAVPQPGDTLLASYRLTDTVSPPQGLVSPQQINPAGLSAGQMWVWDGSSYVPGTGGGAGGAGAIGATGPAGVAGAAGPAGATGPDGAVGPAGATGPAGAAGPSGADGSAGAAGATGAAGPAGATGIAGAPGTTGATGATGAAGPAGATGIAGAPGATGATGPAGATGPSGTGGGPGGSFFTGSTATNPAFSATPTFSLADVSVKSPVRVQPGALTANVSAVTFSNATAGAKFSIAWLQDGTGGRTVAYGGSTANTCTVSPAANVTTTQQFEVAADGTTVLGTGCTSNDAWKGIGATESSAPSGLANTDFLYADAAAHRWKELNNNGTAAQVVLSGVDVNTSDQVTATHLALSLPVNQGGTGIASASARQVTFTASCGAAADSVTAGAMLDHPASGSSTATCFGTTTTQGAEDFVDAATTGGSVHFRLPAGWTGNVDATLAWFANAASANAVRWSIATGCVADSGAISTGPSYNTASAANSAYIGTANQRQTTTLSGLSTTGCAAGSTLYIQVQRIGADAGDTLAATAELLELTVIFRVTPQV
jgi:hypothetical protein